MKTVTEILAEASILTKGMKRGKIPRFVRQGVKKLTGFSLAQYRKPSVRPMKKVFRDEQGNPISRDAWMRRKDERARARAAKVQTHRPSWAAKYHDPRPI